MVNKQMKTITIPSMPAFRLENLATNLQALKRFRAQLSNTYHQYLSSHDDLITISHVDIESYDSSIEEIPERRKTAFILRLLIAVSSSFIFDLEKGALTDNLKQQYLYYLHTLYQFVLLKFEVATDSTPPQEQFSFNLSLVPNEMLVNNEVRSNWIKKTTITVLSQTNSNQESSDTIEQIATLMADVCYKHILDNEKTKQLISLLYQVAQRLAQESSDSVDYVFLCLCVQLTYATHSLQEKTTEIVWQQIFDKVSTPISTSSFLALYYSDINYFLKVLRVLYIFGIACKKFDEMERFFDEIAFKLMLEEYDDQNQLQEVNIEKLFKDFIQYLSTFKFNHEQVVINNKIDFQILPLNLSILHHTFMAQNFKTFLNIVSSDHCALFSFSCLIEEIKEATDEKEKMFYAQVLDLIAKLTEFDIDILEDIVNFSAPNQKVEDIFISINQTLKEQNYLPSIQEKIQQFLVKYAKKTEPGFVGDKQIVKTFARIEQIEQEELRKALQESMRTYRFFSRSYHTIAEIGKIANEKIAAIYSNYQLSQERAPKIIDFILETLRENDAVNLSFVSEIDFHLKKANFEGKPILWCMQELSIMLNSLTIKWPKINDDISKVQTIVKVVLSCEKQLLKRKEMDEMDEEIESATKKLKINN